MRTVPVFTVKSVADQAAGGAAAGPQQTVNPEPTSPWSETGKVYSKAVEALQNVGTPLVSLVEQL
jgi:hypothetical protein